MRDIQKGPLRLSSTQLHRRLNDGSELLNFEFHNKVCNFDEVAGFQTPPITRYFFTTAVNYNEDAFANVYCFDSDGSFKWQIELLKQVKPPQNWPKHAKFYGSSWLCIFWEKGKLCGYLDWGDIYEIDPETGKVGKFLYKTK